MREKVKYEIEIEFVGKTSESSDEDIAQKLLSHCFNIMKIIQNSNIIITNDLMNNIKKYNFICINNNNNSLNHLF